MATKEVDGFDIDEFFEKHKPPPYPQPGDIIPTEAAEKWGCSLGAAKTKLAQLAKEGKLIPEPRTSRGNGNLMICYRLVEKDA